jgi:hypothetical protein
LIFVNSQPRRRRFFAGNPCRDEGGDTAAGFDDRRASGRTRRYGPVSGGSQIRRNAMVDGPSSIPGR